MANQKNFKTNINQLAQQYTKYTVSRVVDNKADDLLDMEVPADFSEALLENNIEINVLQDRIINSIKHFFCDSYALRFANIYKFIIILLISHYAVLRCQGKIGFGE